MFAAEFEPAVTTTRRRSPRASVALDARLGKTGLDRTLCKVVDLSAHGARLQTYSSLRRGTTIWLTLPGQGAVAADVMWADEFMAGCHFREALTVGQFEALVALR